MAVRHYLHILLPELFSIVTPKIKTLKTRRFGRRFILPQVLLLKIQTSISWSSHINHTKSTVRDIGLVSLVIGLVWLMCQGKHVDVGVFNSRTSGRKKILPKRRIFCFFIFGVTMCEKKILEEVYGDSDGSTRREICSGATLPTTYIIWTDLGLKSGLRGDKSPTNCMSHGRTSVLVWKTGQ
jgi:hypothetical protein